MKALKAPSTYQEWLEYLKWMESHYVHSEDIDRMGEGKIPRGGLLPDSFQKRVVSTVNAMLKRYIRNFNRALNEALEGNEFETVQTLCTRMQKDLEYCFFYRRITFLDSEFIKKLDRSLLSNSSWLYRSIPVNGPKGLILPSAFLTVSRVV